jgi:hypothetical protein
MDSIGEDVVEGKGMVASGVGVLDKVVVVLTYL